VDVRHLLLARPKRLCQAFSWRAEQWKAFFWQVFFLGVMPNSWDEKIDDIAFVLTLCILFSSVRLPCGAFLGAFPFSFTGGFDLSFVPSAFQTATSCLHRQRNFFEDSSDPSVPKQVYRVPSASGRQG
jgi:hypothetical protein